MWNYNGHKWVQIEEVIEEELPAPPKHFSVEEALMVARNIKRYI